MRLPTILLLLFPIGASLAAPSYEVIDLGTLPGCHFSRGTDLNDRGHVVGWAETTNNISRAFFWKRGQMNELRIKGAKETLAVSINNKDEIAGGAVVDGKRRTFVWLEKATLDLGVIDNHPVLGLPGNSVAGGRINENSQVVFSLADEQGEKRTAIWRDGTTSFPYAARKDLTTSGIALNNLNEIAGQMFTWKRETRSTVFLWRNQELSDLGGLGGNRASATRINDQGVITGWAIPPNQDLKHARAFVFHDGGMRDLGTLGGRASRAYGLNENGLVVGYSHVADGSASAFVWRVGEGAMRDLNDLIDPSAGWSLFVANAVNKHGQILAQGSKDGRTRAVLLNPSGLEFALRAPSASNPSPESERSLTPASDTPAFASLERLANGGVRLSLPAASASDSFSIEYSENLRDWKPLGRPARQDGRLQFIDLNAQESPIRFYRVVRLSGSGS